jgi:hypothetical protein
MTMFGYTTTSRNGRTGSAGGVLVLWLAKVRIPGCQAGRQASGAALDPVAPTWSVRAAG